MGMYDTITCERILPFLPENLVEVWGSSNEIGFQTKSLENALDLYKINQHGELLLRHEVLDQENSNLGDPNAESIGDRLPQLKYIDKGFQPTKFNGTVIFYTDYQSEGCELSGWVEYSAEFIDGLLQGDIKFIKHSCPRNRTEAEKIAIEKNKKYFEQKRQERKAQQLEEIKKAKVLIDSLKQVEESIYQSLLENLGVSEEDDIENYIFDYIFNDNHYLEETITSEL